MKEKVCKETKAVRALSFIQNTKTISLETKVNLYIAILVNLALQNTKIWLDNKEDFNRLDLFYCKRIMHILYILIKTVKEKKFTNRKLQQQFRNIKALNDLEI